ncbi:MAG TPA: hypothetical protein VFD70_30925 [Anaerolineae bacterium]|nr:hypothetical protein [Anaerolineae bacterium]
MGYSSLSWSLYENPLLGNNLLLPLDRCEFATANFSTLAQGGFGPAELIIALPPRAMMLDAISNWLMRRVLVTDDGGDTAYEGYIAEIECQAGAHRVGRRIEEMINKVHVMYAKDETTTVRLRGGSGLEDADSQARWCRKEGVLDLTGHGVMGEAQAKLRGKVYLAHHKLPKQYYVTLGGDPQPPEIRLGIYGYYATLAYNWTQKPYKRSRELGSIVIDQIDAAGTQFTNKSDSSYPYIVTTGTSITYNTMKSWQDVQTYIANAAQYGNSQSQRLFFQMWEDRTCFLRARPTTVGYYSRSDQMRVWNAGRAPFPKWMVRAGDYMLLEDWFQPMETFSDIDSDPRAVLIESTHYDCLTDQLTTEPLDADGVEVLLGHTLRKKDVHI